MKVIFAENLGFCVGVKRAVEAALNNAPSLYTYGELIHNNIVLNELKEKGVEILKDLSKLKKGDRILIRSHGITKKEEQLLSSLEAAVFDATCPFVKKIHKIVEEHFLKGYQIVIIGEKLHPEVIGINGWCDDSAIIINGNSSLEELEKHQKLCFVAQTTFKTEKYKEILKKIDKLSEKTVVIFDTICYTTYARQLEAEKISAISTKMLVLGSQGSSNTTKLYDICLKNCAETFLIENVCELKKINFKANDTVGVVAGASTPQGLITEVKDYMAQQDFEEVLDQEFIAGVEESLVKYKEGKRVKGTVIFADESGIKVRIGGKKDGFIPSSEVNAEGEYNPDDFSVDSEIEAILTSKNDESGCVLLSKKKVDIIKEGDKVVETIRNGEVFEFKAEKDTKGGLLGKIGTYTVFIPASQIREGFVKDLKTFVNKPLRLTAIEIDDAKHKIVASQRKVLETERKAKEEIFWSHVQPNVIVSGKVKRITVFGAFVSVDGFDCLAHIVDLSWNHIKSVDEVLKIGETYDFLVLSVDKEKGRVSLSYKLLQPHPFEKCIEQHPIGSVTKGKVTSLMPFGAFVEIESGIEGLVHVSEAARGYVKNINEIVKVGDEVDVMILNADPESKKITLSIKATLPEEEVSLEEAAAAEPNKKGKRVKKEETVSVEKSQWNDETQNTPFKDLLQNLDLDDKE